MDLIELQRRALNIRAKYAELEKHQGNQEWSNRDLVQGFVGDVGDLVKLTMAKDGLRDIPDVDKKLQHELSDCLWSILVIAKKYNVDIEKSFFETMNELEEKIALKLQK
jgi:NTP pyrophosphatase (non-canonical NTP hydrolase)